MGNALLNGHETIGNMMVEHVSGYLPGPIRDARGRCLGMALARPSVHPLRDRRDGRDCGGYEILGAVKVKVG